MRKTSKVDLCDKLMISSVGKKRDGLQRTGEKQQFLFGY
jgi:hypothetical protein